VILMFWPSPSFQDGRLRKNDQLLSVNQHHLVGCSNQEAMEILKRALKEVMKATSQGAASKEASSVQLTVARRVAMAALGEEPEEVGVVVKPPPVQLS